MMVTLRNGRDWKEYEHKKAKMTKKEETEEETKLSNSELVEETEKKRCKLSSRWRKEK